MAKNEELMASTMPEGIVLKRSKYLGAKWENKYCAENGITTDAEKKEVHEDFVKRYTVHVDFDFADVTVQEMVDQLTSTTSYSKMLYNNDLKNWTQEEAEEGCKTPYLCAIRQMLDGRKVKAKLSDAQKAKRDIGKMIEGGMSKADIIKELGLDIE